MNWLSMTSLAFCLTIGCHDITMPIEDKSQPNEEKEVEEVETVERALFGRLLSNTVWFIPKGKYIGYGVKGVYVQEVYDGPWQILQRNEYNISTSWIHIVYNAKYVNFRYKIVIDL